MLLSNNELKSKLSALDASQALIEFDLEGKVYDPGVGGVRRGEGLRHRDGR